MNETLEQKTMGSKKIIVKRGNEKHEIEKLEHLIPGDIINTAQGPSVYLGRDTEKDLIFAKNYGSVVVFAYNKNFVGLDYENNKIRGLEIEISSSLAEKLALRLILAEREL